MLGLILTFLFGPIGMLYSTVIGALVMMVIGGGLVALTGGLALIIVWPIMMFWTWSAIAGHNKRLQAQFQRAVERERVH